MERIAVVELSVDKAKMVIADTFEDSFVVVETFSEPISLGFDAGQDHFLKKPQIEEVIEIMRSYKKLCERFSVVKTYARSLFLQTAKPKNMYSFFDEIFATSGFKFILISDEDRLFSLYSGVINTLDVPKAITVDIGFDSICLVQYNRRKIVGQVVLPFGMDSLLDRHPNENYKTNKERFDAIKKLLMVELKKQEWLCALEPEVQFVCAGDVGVDIARMVKRLRKYPLDLTHGLVCETADVNVIYSQVMALEMDKAKSIKGLCVGKADCFCAALAILEALFELTKATELTTSNYSSIEGYLFNLCNQMTLEKPISDVLGYSLAAQTKYYDATNDKHNNQIYNLALLIYKQLKVLHKLPRGYVKVLRAAAMMHDTGKRISSYNHPTHGFYVTLNSEIFGLSHREKLLASYVVFLHEGGEIPLADWVSKKDLVTDEDLAAVKKLGIILRLAECFDISGTNAIVDINCDILGDSVIMKTFTDGDNAYEIAESHKVQKDFEKQFKKRLEVL